MVRGYWKSLALRFHLSLCPVLMTQFLTSFHVRNCLLDVQYIRVMNFVVFRLRPVNINITFEFGPYTELSSSEGIGVLNECYFFPL